MTDDELERLLGDAFDAQARAALGDAASPPPPRFLDPAATPTALPAATAGDGPADTAPPLTRAARHATPRRRRLLAPLAAAAAVVAIAGGALALTRTGGSDHPSRPAGAASGRHVTATPASRAASSAAPAAAVHVKLLNSDGAHYGVGMPVIAYFSRAITDGRALQQATTVTVDGKVEHAAWYFERSSYYQGYPVEGHLRLQGYWPAHAAVHVALPVQGRSAGAGLAYDDDLTLDFHTGAAMISVVNDRTHRMTVTRDGHPVGTYPVSLGSSATPTSHGTKVIMEQGASICMQGPGYRECGIKYTQRLTYSGEYLHAAPWNTANIEKGIDSSNGCTNLTVSDARTLYSQFEVGDIVQYPNADGPAMTLGAGYGDWNVSWSTWLEGGLVRTR